MDRAPVFTAWRVSHDERNERRAEPGEAEAMITQEIGQGSLAAAAVTQAKIQSLNGTEGQAPRRLFYSNPACDVPGLECRTGGRSCWTLRCSSRVK